MPELLVTVATTADIKEEWAVSYDGDRPTDEEALELVGTDRSRFMKDWVWGNEGDRELIEVHPMHPPVIDQLPTGPPQVAVWALTMETVEAMAGRAITAGEAERIAKAIEHSTINETIEAAVQQVVGLRFTDESEATDG